jgi:hypothetical protein
MADQALPLVVISHYDRRPVEPLIELLDSMQRHPAGAVHHCVVMTNKTHASTLPMRVTQRIDACASRPNVGMNIGAWDGAWRRWRGRPAYLFLQDDCMVTRPGWLQAVLGRLEDPRVGLVGESLNHAWNKPWDALREAQGRDVLPEHTLQGQPANRVDVYLQAMRDHGIDPGDCGRHLRSLVWGARGEILERLRGFPLGSDYGTCIAAEIGTSRAVEAMGLQVAELGPTPFHYIRHRDWNQDMPGGSWTHRPAQLQERDRLRQQVATLEQRLASATRPGSALAGLRAMFARNQRQDGRR